MKAVLASLKPYWYYLVGEGIKTVEVRKTFPKADDWSKDTFFYMSRDEKSFAEIPKEFQEKYRKHFGKVGMRFVCPKISHWWWSSYDGDFNDGGEYNITDEQLKATCLTYSEFENYGDTKILHGLNITDLVVYDEPRELGEFIVPSKIGCCNEGKCRGCKYLDRGNGFNIEDDCNAKFSTDEFKPLRRPPQSWCYVEEVRDET